MRRRFVDIAALVAVQVGRRPSLTAPARRRPSRRTVAPARLATPARAAPSCSPAGPLTSQPGARLGSRPPDGGARGRGSARRSLAIDPLPTRSNAPHPCRGRPSDAFPHDASFRRLASCANPFGALEHACGQRRGSRPLSGQIIGVLYSVRQLSFSTEQRLSIL